MQPYVPINCEFHDVIEDAATRRRPVEIEYLDADGQKTRKSVVITDVRAQGGAEFLFTNCGDAIRLDALLTIGGSRPGDF